MTNDDDDCNDNDWVDIDIHDENGDVLNYDGILNDDHLRSTINILLISFHHLYNVPSSEKRLVALKLTTVTAEEYQNILDSPIVEATVANADDDMESE